jgi:hypothetical protein
VARYVSTWRFRTAPPDGFVRAAAAESPPHATRLRSLAQRWFRETHGDEDLGQADLGSILGTMTGGNVPPEMRDAMRVLGPLLGGGNAPSSTPAQGAPQGPSPQEIQQMLQQALQGLGGL